MVLSLLYILKIGGLCWIATAVLDKSDVDFATVDTGDRFSLDTSRFQRIQDRFFVFEYGFRRLVRWTEPNCPLT